MTPGDTGRVLAAIAARDQRTVGHADVLAWHEDIGDLDYADALAGVSHHFRTCDARIMPVHIRRYAVARAAERRDADRRLTLTASLERRPDALDPQYALGQIRAAWEIAADARRVREDEAGA